MIYHSGCLLKVVLAALSGERAISFQWQYPLVFTSNSDVTPAGNASPDNALLSAQAGCRDLTYLLRIKIKLPTF